MNMYTPTVVPKGWADGVPVFCAHDVVIPVNELYPNPKNPNTHPDSQIQLLGRIIRQTGWRQPITVSNSSGFIVKGHGRLAAALLEGMKEVPVDYQSYSTEAEEYADMVADNRLAELAEIDQKMLAEIFAEIDTDVMPMELTGYTDDEAQDIMDALSDALNEKPEDVDDIPETTAPEDVITQPGDLWILGRHRVVCGDSTAASTYEQLMADEVADMVFTDPPYGYSYQSNMRTKSQQFDVLTNDDKILDFMPAMNQYIDGFVFICTTWKTLDKWLPLFAEHYDLTNMIIWDKGGGGIGDLAHTFSTDYEIILCSNNGHELTGKRIGSVWSINKDNPNTYVHPTQKPVALMELAIESTTFMRDIVLDVFGGSGSTLIACEITGRYARLIELEPVYVDVIVRRYVQTTGDKAGVRLVRNGKELSREHYESMFAE